MSVDLSFADALLKELYVVKAQLLSDLNRTFFFDPNPPYGPPLPKRWYGQQDLFDGDPYRDWSVDSYEDDCDCDCCRG